MTGDMEPARPELPEGNTLQPLKDQIAALRNALPADEKPVIQSIDDRICWKLHDQWLPDIHEENLRALRRIMIAIGFFVAALLSHLFVWWIK